MLQIVSQNYPIWYFDATGSVHKQIKSQPKPFFYSLVFHDQKTKSIIPLAEFVTTDRSSSNISKYLAHIFNLIDNHAGINCKRVAPIIVTDFSWALIYSVLKEFNSSTIINYLNWCFQILVYYQNNQNISNLFRTRIYLCSTHFLKNMI